MSSGLGTQVASISPALASHMGHCVPLMPLRNQSWRLGRAAPHCPSPFQVEKSLQRIQNGQRNAMYTSQQSVENKVGGTPGWQALLTAVGFRLDPPTSGLPAAVFFPTSDPGDRLQQCSSTIQSLLGEPQAGQGPEGAADSMGRGVGTHEGVGFHSWERVKEHPEKRHSPSHFL